MASSLRSALTAAARTVARPAAQRPVIAAARRQISISSRLYKGADADEPLDRDLEVGELQGAKFKIEPLRRVGEDPETMRARLVCMLPYHPLC